MALADQQLPRDEGVDAAVDAVKAADGCAAAGGPETETKLTELVDREHRMLHGRQRCQSPIKRDLAPITRDLAPIERDLAEMRSL
jgi:hypothetical protein